MKSYYDENTESRVYTCPHCNHTYHEYYDYKKQTENQEKPFIVLDEKLLYFKPHDYAADEVEANGQEFYQRAEEELEERFGCKNAYLEPSVQYGRGRTYLYADDMTFDGSFDFQIGEEFVKDNDFEGFLELCFDSFTPKTEELDESSEECTDVQYGVHRFSTESIIFRGTEEECGKFIDDRQWLWDDAEIYTMTPDDPHYIKDCSDLED